MKIKKPKFKLGDKIFEADSYNCDIYELKISQIHIVINKNKMYIRYVGFMKKYNSFFEEDEIDTGKGAETNSRYFTTVDKAEKFLASEKILKGGLNRCNDRLNHFKGKEKEEKDTIARIHKIADRAKININK